VCLVQAMTKDHVNVYVVCKLVASTLGGLHPDLVNSCLKPLSCSVPTIIQASKTTSKLEGRVQHGTAWSKNRYALKRCHFQEDVQEAHQELTAVARYGFQKGPEGVPTIIRVTYFTIEKPRTVENQENTRRMVGTCQADVWCPCAWWSWMYQV